MKAEGDCPECGGTLGTAIDTDSAPIPESTLKRFVDSAGDGMYCQTCDDYKEPEDLEVK